MRFPWFRSRLFEVLLDSSLGALLCIENGEVGQTQRLTVPQGEKQM